MASERKLTVVIGGDAKGAQQALKDVQGTADQTGSKFGGMGLAAKAALVGAGASVVAFGKSLFDQATESERVGKQTDAVLKSMGDSAGLSAKQIGDLSTKLSEQSGVDDELIQSGENVLLTFRNVRNEAGANNDIFNRATQTALDMSVALGTDLQSANIQLGKALNDPIKGVSALTRVGVSFTQQQKDQIKTLVQSGDTLGAQKIIMKEVESEFSGSAKSQATSADKLKVTWGNLQEKLGSALIPVVSKFADVMSGLIDTFEGLPGPAQIALGVIAGLGGAVLVVNKAMGLWKAATEAWTGVQRIATGVQVAFNAVMDANPIMLVVLAIAGLVAGLVIAYEKVGWFRDLVNAAFNAIKDVVMGVVTFITDHWQLLLAILTGPIGLAVLFIKDHFDQIVGFVTSIPGRIAGVASSMWNGIKDGITAAKNWVGDRISDVVGFVTGIPGRIAGVASSMWNGVRDGATAMKNWLHDRIWDVIGWVEGMPGRISHAASGMWNGIKDAFRSALNWVIDKWNGLQFKIPSVGFGRFHTPSFTLGMPNVPRLAAGGIVQARLGGILAQLGEGGANEAVTPLTASGLQPWVNAILAGIRRARDFEQQVSQSVGQPIVIRFELDGRVLFESMLPVAAARAGRNGFSLTG